MNLTSNEKVQRALEILAGLMELPEDHDERLAALEQIIADIEFERSLLADADIIDISPDPMSDPGEVFSESEAKIIEWDRPIQASKSRHPAHRQ